MLAIFTLARIANKWYVVHSGSYQLNALSSFLSLAEPVFVGFFVFCFFAGSGEWGKQHNQLKQNKTKNCISQPLL